MPAAILLCPLLHKVCLWCVQELDHAVTILINDNLELACAVIEKTATDKAVRDIDERLLPAYQVHSLLAWADPCCIFVAFLISSWEVCWS